MSKLMSQSEFARHIKQSRQHVSALKQAGRLVMQGRMVDAEKSIEFIKQTGGSRDDVKARHAESRKSGSAEKEQISESIKEAHRIKVMAESRRVAAIADKEEMERDKLAGDLIAKEDVDASMKFIGASVRALLDVFPDQVAPMLAPVTDINECHALLTEQCRNILVRLGEAIEQHNLQLAGNHA